MISMNKLFELLKKENLSPKFYDHDKNGFSRRIYFIVNNAPCYIEWWPNNGYLSIGQKYLSYIPFTDMQIDTNWPSYEKGLKFTYKKEYLMFESCWLAIDKLDWQNKKRTKE